INSGKVTLIVIRVIKCRRGGLINYIAYVQASRFCSSHSGFASFVRKICRDCNDGFADRPQFACCSLLELLQYEGAELGGGKFPSSNKIAFRGSHISFDLAAASSGAFPQVFRANSPTSTRSP